LTQDFFIYSGSSFLSRAKFSFFKHLANIKSLASSTSRITPPHMPSAINFFGTENTKSRERVESYRQASSSLSRRLRDKMNICHAHVVMPDSSTKTHERARVRCSLWFLAVRSSDWAIARSDNGPAWSLIHRKRLPMTDAQSFRIEFSAGAAARQCIRAPNGLHIRLFR
jgi:hypothetical protein